ncbi:unnamed protein product, partial [Mycena citricolor]
MIIGGRGWLAWPEPVVAASLGVHPWSESTLSPSSSDRSGSGSFPSAGSSRSFQALPFLVNAPDFCRNSASATIPSFVPSISVRPKLADVARMMGRWSSYMGHSRRICSL